MGGYLVNKFVKQAKVNSGFAHESCIDQVLLAEAEPDERTDGTRILGESNSAMG
jgi:hypothetical protein